MFPEFLSLLRRNNIFGNMGSSPAPTGINFGAPIPQPNPMQGADFGARPFTPEEMQTSLGLQNPALESIGDAMSGYTPQTEATNRFNQLAGSYPTREKPGKLRAIGSMLVDFAKGPEQGQAFYDKPFTDKLTDWKNQIGPAQTAANLERYENVNNRTLAYQSGQLKARENEGKIRQQRADTYDYKTKFPQHKITAQKDGYLYATDPLTNETSVLTDKEGNPIKSNAFSTKERMELQQTQALERIKETEKAAEKLEEVKQPHRLEVVKEKGAEAQETKSTPSGGASTKAEKPGEYKVRVYNAAQKIKVRDPKGLGRYIKITGQNTFEIKGRPSPSELMQINTEIYGNPNGPQDNKNAGKVIVMKDNKKFYLPKEQLAEAIKQGYQQVQ